jgi:hypothetical protein
MQRERDITPLLLLFYSISMIISIILVVPVMIFVYLEYKLDDVI